MPYTAEDLKNIEFFQDDSIVSEEAHGLKITDDGTWQQNDIDNPEKFLTKFEKFQEGVSMFKSIMDSGSIVQTTTGLMAQGIRSTFGPTGTLETGKFECPVCHKKVDMLLKNGYCSKICAVKARAARAQATVTAAGEKTLEFINKVKEKLQMLDMVLNLITELPELIKDKAKLPQQYRDYVTLRIDAIFLELKKCVNILMIKKNELLIELMKKIKNGVLDPVLGVLLAPLQPILTTVIAVQQALNAAMAAVVALLNVPMTGLRPQSYGWLMTGKSVQYGETAGRLIVEIVPKANIALPLQNMLNNMNYPAIEAVIQGALPPIQDFEYFLDPTVFKVRYALSVSNAPRVKKLFQMLEGLLVFGADTFPRYNRLKLTNVWFVISIFTGWGPLSRGVYGDFIFHGAI